MSLLHANELSVVRDAKKILTQINLTLNEGEVVGLIGPNGSGKSTLLKTLSGLIKPAEGQIEILNRNLHHLPTRERARLITYVGSDFDSDFPLTALEAVRLGDYPHSLSFRETYELSKTEAAMRETACWELRDRKLNSLSSGERQRVSLARAFFQSAKVIFLDESVVQLDLHHQARIGEVIRKKARSGTTFVLVSHDLNFTSQWSDRLILLSHGHMMSEGCTNEVLNEKNLKMLYPGAEFDFVDRPQGGNRLVYFRLPSLST